MTVETSSTNFQDAHTLMGERENKEVKEPRIDRIDTNEVLVSCQLFVSIPNSSLASRLPTALEAVERFWGFVECSEFSEFADYGLYLRLDCGTLADVTSKLCSQVNAVVLGPQSF